MIICKDENVFLGYFGDYYATNHRTMVAYIQDVKRYNDSLVTSDDFLEYVFNTIHKEYNYD